MVFFPRVFHSLGSPSASAGRRSVRFARRSLVGISIALAVGAVTSADDAVPRAAPETVETSLVQVDVRVLDPGGDPFASVPGLTLDHFDIRVEGDPLASAERARVGFDALCGERAPDRSLVILVLDLGFANRKGRETLANSLETLAERLSGLRQSFLVYALSTRIWTLVGEPMRDPDALRAIAGRLRELEIAITAEQEEAWLERIAPSGGEPAGLDERGLVLDLHVELRDEVQRTRASLAMLETILRAHDEQSGTKSVVLMTSDRFSSRGRRDAQILTEDLERILELAQARTTIWTVDMRGLRSRGRSTLISSLARDTGGHSLRFTDDLSMVFPRIDRQLSCTYLFSIPVEIAGDRATRRDLDVRIDRERHPELWDLRVDAPAVIRKSARTESLERERAAARLLPGRIGTLPVHGEVSIVPDDESERAAVEARFRVPLAELTWEPSKDEGGDVEARVVAEGSLERRFWRGARRIASLDADEAAEIVLRRDRAPAPGDDAALVVRLAGRLSRAGILTAELALSDVVSGRTGGAHAERFVGRGGVDAWQAGPWWRATTRAEDVLADVVDRDEVALRSEPTRVSERRIVCGPDDGDVPAEWARQIDGAPALEIWGLDSRCWLASRPSGGELPPPRR